MPSRVSNSRVGMTGWSSAEGPASTRIDPFQVFVKTTAELSVTVSVKFDVPVPVGVPVMTPVGDSERPAGKEPAVTVHV